MTSKAFSSAKGRQPPLGTRDRSGTAGDHGVRIEKETAHEEDDPFATFSEWASEADEEAYGNL